MDIYSWNVNGLRAIAKKGFTDWVTEHSPDILCLQETKASLDQLDDELVNIPGYFSYFNSGKKKGYSGVAIYSKTEPNLVEYNIGIARFDEEGRIIIAHYPQFTLLNIYFPNGQRDEDRLSYKLDFYDAVLSYCNSLRENGKRLVICGDYNTAHREIDLKNPKANEKTSGFLPAEREWLDSFIQNGYVDTFRHFHPEQVKYSWWSYRFKARERNAGWRIDYHFVSEDMLEMLKSADILDQVQGSDHCPVVISLK